MSDWNAELELAGSPKAIFPFQGRIQQIIKGLNFCIPGQVRIDDKDGRIGKSRCKISRLIAECFHHILIFRRNIFHE